MTPQPQQEYIITEEMVQCIEAWTEKYPVVSNDIASAIRSHPYTAKSEPPIQHDSPEIDAIIFMANNLDRNGIANVLRNERGQALNEAIALFDSGNYNGQTVRKMLKDLKVQR